MTKSFAAGRESVSLLLRRCGTNYSLAPWCLPWPERRRSARVLARHLNH